MIRTFFSFLLFLVLICALFFFLREIRELNGGFRVGKVLLNLDLKEESMYTKNLENRFLKLRENPRGWKIVNDPILMKYGVVCDLPSPSFWHVPETDFPSSLCIEPSNEILSILHQPFVYLDQGCQSYVFQSQDGQYVLKLVRTARFHPPFWMGFVPLTEVQKERFSKGRKKNLVNSLRSYEIALSCLQKETQVLYAHLQETEHLPAVRLKNGLLQTIELDLNRVGFLLQKKVIPMKKALLEKKKDPKAKREIVASFVQLVSSMQNKKIRNRDYNCVKNAGVVGTKAMFLDAGSFAFEEKELSFSEYEERMRHFLRHFYRFAKRHDPELINCLDQEIAKRLEEKKRALER